MNRHSGIRGIVVVVATGLMISMQMASGRGISGKGTQKVKRQSGGVSGGAPGFEVCSKQVNVAEELQHNKDVQRINQTIERKFNTALNKIKHAPPSDEYHRQLLLGTLELHDKNLSVDRNQACTTCHTADTGFTSGVSLFNQTIVSFPGSVRITDPKKAGAGYRVEARKPMPYVYAPYSPVFHYNLTAKKFFGGNFWDMRATGDRTGNPAIAQAMDPPLDPNEMGFADPACIVYRLSRSPYRAFFETVWGKQSFAISWPKNVNAVCSKPAMRSSNPPPNENKLVKLSARDRGTASSTYTHFATSIALEEASPDESPFTSKFDEVIAGKAKFTPAEQRGWHLFNGKARCNHCHESGATTNPTGLGSLPVRPPLFTDWASHNIGVPKNLALRYYCETKPDQFGYTINPKGMAYTDNGVADFLDGKQGHLVNPAWGRLAREFKGEFMTNTLRDVDKRPYLGFVKSYFHNGYAKSLKEVVHFYNTSQKYPHCPQGSPGEKKTCWPEPEVKENLETKDVGNLGLTDQEENDVVAFLKTLTDQYTTSPEKSDYVQKPTMKKKSGK